MWQKLTTDISVVLEICFKKIKVCKILITSLLYSRVSLVFLIGQLSMICKTMTKQLHLSDFNSFHVLSNTVWWSVGDLSDGHISRRRQWVKVFQIKCAIAQCTHQIFRGKATYFASEWREGFLTWYIGDKICSFIYKFSATLIARCYSHPVLGLIIWWNELEYKWILRCIAMH